MDNNDSDIAPVQIRRKKLIDDTLQTFDGEVVGVFLLNDVKHIIKRNSKTQEILLKIGDNEFVSATELEVRNLFPAQAYSQKQLSSIGVRIEELKRFVELPIKQSLDKIKSDIRDTEAKIKTAYGNLNRKREVEAEIAKYSVETNSLANQIETLRKALKGLSESDQEIIKQKAQYDNEEVIIDGLKNELTQAEELVDSLVRDFNAAAGAPDDDLEVLNTALIKSIRAKYTSALRDVKVRIGALTGLFKPAALKVINDEVTKWGKLKSEFDKKYEAAKGRATVNQQKLQQIQDVEKRITELKKLQAKSKSALVALGNPANVYNGLRTNWNDLHSHKIRILDSQCQKFSALSNGIIRADIKGSFDVGVLKHKLKIAFASLNIQERKIDDLCGRVLAAADPIGAWNGILTELEKLALRNSSTTDPMPPTPILDACGFISSEKSRLATGFDSSRWLELSTVELEFNPIFQYSTNKNTGEFIAFSDASAGQQATALLTVLLNQQGAPLIIDQPEDDVDSKMSPDIVRQIWKAKSRRQLIFASHNANFVVNGDAELVVCCDYVKAGDQTGGQIKAVGAIDNAGIRDEITAVTEGGKEAFKLRKEKYGF